MEKDQSIYTITIDEDISKSNDRVGYHVMQFLTTTKRMNKYNVDAISLTPFNGQFIITVIVSGIEYL